jgi:molybdopterin molybdotransferase
MPADMPRPPSCADDRDPGVLSVDEARARILAQVDPIATRQLLSLRAALGRTLAEPVISPIDVPSHTNSAMDGYALAGGSLAAGGVTELNLAGEAYAGHPFPEPVAAGQCVRIMTGAPMPAGTDTVVMQEQAEAAGGRVRLAPGQRPGQNVRQAGEDLAAGSRVHTPGRVLTPADLGLIASLGIPEVSVLRRPRAAFFSTGDELRSVGQPLAEGEIYDSNRYTLYGMLSRLGADLLDLGVVRDEPRQLEAALERAAADADLVITSGGVSVGEADYMRDILARAGQAHFWKIAMKPGRPLTFGRVGGALFFGLPGNPVAVMVTFYQFVRPALIKLMTGRAEVPLVVEAEATFAQRKRPGRTEFMRGVLDPGLDGRLRVGLTGKQGSGVLRSMSLADCFILLPEERGDVAPGDRVLVQPFAGLV